MSEAETVYENIDTKRLKPKSGFFSFPWKSRNGVSQTKQRKAIERSKSVSNHERPAHVIARSSPSDVKQNLSVSHSKDDWCTGSYHLKRDVKHVAPTASSSQRAADLEMDVPDAASQARDDRRSHIFSSVKHNDDKPGRAAAASRARRDVFECHPSTFATFETIGNRAWEENVYENLDELRMQPNAGGDRNETEDSDSDVTLENVNCSNTMEQSSVSAVCEVKPTVRTNAADFKRQRNLALKRASSVRKTVTFNLDSTDEFDPADTGVCSSMPTTAQLLDLPQPVSGIMKHKQATQHTQQEHCDSVDDDDDISRSSQLSPNGTSSDSGRDSFLSCCSECTCSSPSHSECQRPQCQSNAAMTSSSQIGVSNDRYKYSTEYVLSRLEDSIQLAKTRKTQDSSSRKPLESASTVRSAAEYLNVDVAHAILVESQQSDFATYKSKDAIYAAIKASNDLTLKKAAPALPPREKIAPRTDDDTVDNKRRGVSPVHHRSAKSDLLMMNKFHSYTLGDVMTNYSTLLQDIPEDKAVNEAKRMVPNADGAELASSHSAALPEELRNLSDKRQLVKDQLRLIKGPHTNPAKQQTSSTQTSGAVAKSDNTAFSQREFGQRQKYFLAQHKQRSYSDNSLIKPSTLRVINPLPDQKTKDQFYAAKPVPTHDISAKIQHASSQNRRSQCMYVQQPNTASAPAAIIRHNDAQRLPTDTYSKHQAYVNKSRSWSCVPDNLRGSPFQAVMGASLQTSSHNDVSQSRLMTSPYIQRQFPDVRWIGKRIPNSNQIVSQSNLSKSVSRSEPTIKWTKSEMAEIFC